ncbi:MAG: MarR family transcriptional regulator [Faecalibacterium prausnitzii]
MNPNIEFSIKTAQAYNAVCKPLCQELGLSQTALDILLFLANNPDYKTARDIVEVRHIKANLVSMNVDKLVQEGYLERYAVAGDRRKTKLLCTGKGRPDHPQGACGAECLFSSACWIMWSQPIEKVFFRTMRD